MTSFSSKSKNPRYENHLLARATHSHNINKFSQFLCLSLHYWRLLRTINLNSMQTAQICDLNLLMLIKLCLILNPLLYPNLFMTSLPKKGTTLQPLSNPKKMTIIKWLVGWNNSMLPFKRNMNKWSKNMITKLNQSMPKLLICKGEKISLMTLSINSFSKITSKINLNVKILTCKINLTIKLDPERPVLISWTPVAINKNHQSKMKPTRNKASITRASIQSPIRFRQCKDMKYTN